MANAIYVMGHSMPKIHLLNIEETQNGDVLSNINNHLQKYLWNAKEKDVYVVPFVPDPYFLNYIKKIKCHSADFQVISLNKLSEPYNLIESICGDSILSENLKQLLSKDEWEIAPYIQTKNIVRFSNKFHVKFKTTKPELIENGLIDKLNCKLYFKNICEQLGLKMPAWHLVHDSNEAKQYLKTLNGSKKVIFKKTKSAGGFGNLSGYPKELLQQLTERYDHPETLLIEEHYNFKQILGSLSLIKPDKVTFLDIDEQIIRNNGWIGLKFPADISQNVRDEIMLVSEKVGNLFAKLGGNDCLNLDFGVTVDKNNKTTLYALESNFRYNAFSVFFENFARADRKLYYCDNFKTKAKTFVELINQLNCKLIDNQPLLAENIHADNGIIIINHNPNQNSLGALIFGVDNAYLDKAREMLLTINEETV